MRGSRAADSRCSHELSGPTGFLSRPVVALHCEILTRVTELTKLLASTKSPARVTEVLRTMLPPPGIAQLWNLAALGSKRTTVFGVDPDSLYQMMSLIAEMP